MPGKVEENGSSQDTNCDIEAMSHTGLLFPLVIISILRCVAASALDLPLQLYLRDLQAQPIIISLLSTLTWLGMLVGSLLWGALGDRFSRKGLLFLILPASALTLASFALMLPSSGVLVIRLIRAVVISGFAPITMAMVSSVSSRRGRGRNLSYISSSRALGWMLGGAVSGFLLEAIGFRWTVSVVAFLPLVSLVPLFFLRVPQEVATHNRSPFWRYLRDKGLRALYLGVMFRQMGIAGSFSLIFVYMASVGISAGLMGVVSGLTALAQVLGLVLFGRLADLLGRKTIFLVGFGLSVFVAPVFALAQGVWGMAVGHLLVGTAFSALYMGSTAHIGDVIPAERHAVMLGLFDSTRALGGVFGPLVAGLVMPLFGFRGMFVTMAGITAFGFLLVLAGTRTRTDVSSMPT